MQAVGGLGKGPAVAGALRRREPAASRRPNGADTSWDNEVDRNLYNNRAMWFTRDMSTLTAAARTRRYQETHPWLTFHFDSRKLQASTWMLLGEAASKCEHVAGVPLKPEISRELMLVYLSKGAHGTTSIEGNTLSEDEVKRRVEDDLELPKSREYLGEEIDNIVELYNDVLRRLIQRDLCPVTPTQLLSAHEKLLRGQPAKRDVVPGEFRTHSVGVGQYLGAPAEDCEFLMHRLCDWLQSSDFVAPPGLEQMQPALSIIRAMLAHLYVAWIHPFADGNGRVARLVEFELLVQTGFPVPAAHVLSDHYNRTREAYYSALDATSRKPGYPVEAFINYAVQGLVDELREQISKIRDYQMDVTWDNHVHEQFRDQDTPARRRQKHIALDLPVDVWTKSSAVRHVSVRVAEAYAGKTPKTVSRDLNYLASLSLIDRSTKGIRPNRSLITAFLPPRADS